LSDTVKVADLAHSNKLIIIVPDIFGIEAGHHCEIADWLAVNGTANDGGASASSGGGFRGEGLGFCLVFSFSI
jgi:hypothetical protein